MAWGQTGARGIDDLVRRVASNDPKLTSLTILRQRRFNHDDVASFVQAMASNTHLRELFASGHSLAPHTASLLADMLAASPHLRDLCVGDSALGDDGVAALARGIAASSLTRLDLTNKGVSPRGAEALGAALATAASLTHLLLSANPLLADAGLTALCSGDGGGGGGGDAAAPSPSVWAGVRVLELQGCGITAAGVCRLAASPNCRGLEVLRLDGNPLGPQGGEALGHLLRAAPRLRELHVRDTGLGEEGGSALAASLPPAVAAVPEASSDASDEAAVAAAAPGSVAGDVSGAGELPSGSSSATPGRLAPLDLDLADCGLGARAMSALSDAFTRGARLGQLCLAGNPAISDADAAALGTVIGPSTHPHGGPAEPTSEPALAHLDLSGTAAGPEAVAALSEAVGLRHLSMVGCPLRAPGAAQLASSLAAPATPAGDQAPASAPSASSPSSSRAPRWSALRELCVSGTGLSVEDLGAVFSALAAGGAPELRSLEVGANPGTQVESFLGLLEALRAARPDLAVYWRSGDDPAPPVAR